MSKRRRKAGARGEAATRRMLKQALARPGVRALVRVYGRCRAVDAAVHRYRQVTDPQAVVSASNSSRPLTW